MSDDQSLWLMVPLVIVLALPMTYWHLIGAKAVLQDWAQTNHFRILHAKLCIFPPWRIYMSTSEYRVVYEVSLYDESTHRVRAAWVRLGTRMWGVMKNGAIDVDWAEPDDQAQL